MKGHFLLVLLFFQFGLAFSQSNSKALSTKRGLIVFAGNHEMLFVQTTKTNLKTFLRTEKDTITAYMLYTPDGPSNFKDYLSDKVKFDTMTINVKQENQSGQPYEEESIFWAKYGSIRYSKSKAYKLKRQYKTLHFSNKSLVVALEEYLPIEMFTAETAKRSTKVIIQ